MSNQMPSKLTRNILFLRELSVRIHVKLHDDNFNYYTEYTYNNKLYAKVDPCVFITLDMSKEKDNYSHDKNIMITQLNINSVINAFKTVQKNIYEQKIFGKRDNEIIVYSDMVEKYSFKLLLPRSNNAMVIRPAVVYDENEISYEGVRLFLNKTENTVDLMIEEFETLIYTLSQIDLFKYSQLLLNYIAIKHPNGIYEPPKKEFKKRSSINWDTPPTETVSSNFKKPDNNDLFEGLKSDIL